MTKKHKHLNGPKNMLTISNPDHAAPLVDAALEYIKSCDFGISGGVRQAIIDFAIEMGFDPDKLNLKDL